MTLCPRIAKVGNSETQFNANRWRWSFFNTELARPQHQTDNQVKTIGRNALSIGATHWCWSECRFCGTKITLRWICAKINFILAQIQRKVIFVPQNLHSDQHQWVAPILCFVFLNINRNAAQKFSSIGFCPTARIVPDRYDSIVLPFLR